MAARTHQRPQVTMIKVNRPTFSEGIRTLVRDEADRLRKQEPVESTYSDGVTV